MPVKTVFVDGVAVGAEWFNAMQDIQFDGLNIDGHYPKLSTDSFDSGLEMLLDALTLGGLVTPGTNPNEVDTAAFSYRNSSGEPSSVSASTLTLPDGVWFVSVISGPTDTVGYSYNIPALSIPLARVTVTTGTVTAIEDIRNLPVVDVISDAVECYGGTGKRDLIISSSGVPESTATYERMINPTLSGEVQYKNVTLEAGAILTVKGYLKLKVSGNYSQAATASVVVTPNTQGGKGFNGSVTVQTTIYPTSGSGFGGGSGHNRAASPKYSYLLSPVGSGGATGLVKTRFSGSGNISKAEVEELTDIDSGDAGQGGGGFVIEALGQVTVSGDISAIGGSADNFSYVSGLPVGAYILAGGSGGGSGGCIHLSSRDTVTIVSGASLDVSGGGGGQGYVSPAAGATFGARGGGGGAGGYVVLQAPVTNYNLADITLDGGIKGATTGLTSNTVAGSNGGSYAGFGGESNQDGAVGLVEIIN